MFLEQVSVSHNKQLQPKKIAKKNKNEGFSPNDLSTEEQKNAYLNPLAKNMHQYFSFCYCP